MRAQACLCSLGELTGRPWAQVSNGSTHLATLPQVPDGFKKATPPAAGTSPVWEKDITFPAASAAQSEDAERRELVFNVKHLAVLYASVRYQDYHMLDTHARWSSSSTKAAAVGLRTAAACSIHGARSPSPPTSSLTALVNPKQVGKKWTNNNEGEWLGKATVKLADIIASAEQVIKDLGGWLMP